MARESYMVKLASGGQVLSGAGQHKLLFNRILVDHDAGNWNATTSELELSFSHPDLQQYDYTYVFNINLITEGFPDWDDLEWFRMIVENASTFQSVNSARVMWDWALDPCTDQLNFRAVLPVTIGGPPDDSRAYASLYMPSGSTASLSINENSILTVYSSV